MHRTALRSFICLTVISLLFGSCASHKQYTYENIVAEYGLKDLNGEASQEKAGTKEREPLPDLTSFAQPLGMMEAIRFALRSNPDLFMAVSRIRQSEAMIDEANAAFWPAFSLYTEYLRGDAPSAFLFKKIDQRQLPPDVNFNDPGAFQNFESGLVGRVNLFRGGRDVLRKKMAETGLEIGRLDRKTVENALIASVIQAYYAVLASRDFIKIAESSIEAVSAQLKTVRVRYDAGGALKSELLSLEVRLAQSRADLIAAQNHYELSLASLANLLGADLDTEMNISGVEWQPSELPADYEAGVRTALGLRPELLKARKQIISSRMALDQEQAAYLPQVDAQAKLYFDDENLAYDAERANWTVGVILNWDFFTGFSTKAGVKRARAVLEEMLAADRKATQSIQLDVKTAYLRKAEAQARLDVARAATVQAEEALRLVKREYEGGSANIVRYMDAELALNRARTMETSAHYDTKKAQAEIGRALGYFENSIAEESYTNGGPSKTLH
jgi:outer membrane protein